MLAAAQGDVQFAAPGPGWAQPCTLHRPRPDRQLLASCIRVHGRVLWTHSPDTDPHVAVVAAFHVFVVKLSRNGAVPPIGATITVIGALVRARNGFREVQAWHLEGR